MNGSPQRWRMNQQLKDLIVGINTVVKTRLDRFFLEMFLEQTFS
ncbi:hypothetical protein ABND49_18140 [Paenibacillus larvae]|nr:hypothetical protein [Paenibacillus larvae]